MCREDQAIRQGGREVSCVSAIHPEAVLCLWSTC